MTIVDINGIKLEIDERTATTIEQYKVGDRVKVLVKAPYGDTFSVFPGVIVDFVPFKELPTIEVMYINPAKYDSELMTIVSVNAQSKDLQIAPMSDADLLLDKEDVLAKFDLKIAEDLRAIDALKEKRDYFVSKFATAFGEEV